MKEDDPWGVPESEQLNTGKEQSNPGNKVVEKSSSGEMKVLEKWATSVLKEQRATRRWGILFKSLTFLYLFAIFGLFFVNQPLPFFSDSNESKPHVALVEIKGAIAADAEANADSIIGSLRNAFKAEDSKAVILRINSPGGSPVQAGYIYDEMVRLKTLNPTKPLYAVITDIGASGGYYIAAAADEIYADKASLVGSIGVISSGFGFVDLMEKLGIERRALTAGSSKALLDPFQPLGEEQRVFWQTVLNTTHQQFIEQVKLGRGDRLADNADLFSGLIWTGEQAVELGLIDGLASTSQIAREKLGIDDVKDYTSRPNALEQLTERLGFGMGAAVLNYLQLDLSAQLR